MKLRKLIAILLICVTAFTMLTGCAEKDIGGEWYGDAYKHWHVNENGKKRNIADHELVDNVCSICGGEVLTNEDGTADVHNYTEYGDLSKLTSYDADGNVVTDTKYEYDYDPDGNMFKKTVYEFDVLVEECEYFVDFDGTSILALQTVYSEDGTKLIYEYDGNGNVTKDIFCDIDGFEWVTTEYAYTYLNEEDFFMSTKIEYLEDGNKHIIDYNTFGDIIHWYLIDPYGSAISDFHYEYDYDEQGNKTYSNEYSGSILTNEYEYSLDSDGNVYCSLEIVYNEDETTTQYEYDEQGEIINEVISDTSGNVI